MASRKTTPLGAGLIATKGRAAPTGLPAIPASGPARQPRIPLTVKLTPDRYERLKRLGTKLDRSSQTILVEALDAYLQSHGEGPRGRWLLPNQTLVSLEVV